MVMGLLWSDGTSLGSESVGAFDAIMSVSALLLDLSLESLRDFARFEAAARLLAARVGGMVRSLEIIISVGVWLWESSVIVVLSRFL